MVVIRVILPCATGDEVRYLAQEGGGLLFAKAVASTHIGAIIACLKAWNKLTHYDKSYCN